MKKLLVTFALLLAALPVFAQSGTQVRPQPDCIIPFTFTAAGSGMEFNNKPRFDTTGQFVGGCVTWHLEYSNTGFSVVSIEQQGADASGAAGVAGTYATWSPVASGTTLPLTATTYGQATGYRYQPWVKVKANTLTGTGTVTGILLGWRPLSGQDASAATAAGGGGTGTSATQVQGPAAAGATAVGNPLQGGCGFNSTPATVTNGQIAQWQCNNLGTGLVAPRFESGGSGTSGDGVSPTQTLGSFLDYQGSPRRLAVRNEIFDGTNFNMPRSVINTQDSDGTGLQAAGIVAQFDDTSPTAPTENKFDPVRLDSQRALRVNPEGMKPTYHCSGIVTPAATPTDVIQITGSASKTVRILNVTISVETTAAGIAELLVNRKNSADTGGTSSAPTIGKNDSGSGAATAVCTVYTANPTVNGLVATVGARGVGGTTGPVAVLDYATRSGQAMVLRGTSEFLAVNGNGDTLLAGEKWAYDIEWTEE